MIPMRGVVALVIVVLGAIPAAAAPSEHGMELGQFALADIATIVVNGCIGETSASLKTGVQVRLALTASGPVFHGGEWSALLVPRQGKTRVRVRWTGRDAAGALTVGSTRYDGTTWGEIGTLRWWEHLPRQGG
jgi:hypothetical protein